MWSGDKSLPEPAADLPAARDDLRSRVLAAALVVASAAAVAWLITLRP
jgi:hypothetical protein